jgi:NADH:ubiquinone oxidoreductase subunit 6 (subunit J)
MMISEILLYFFLALACISAGYILFTNNVLYAAFSLALTFLSIAALYVLASAEFLAVTQIMIYVGGIVVLIIFGVMLTNKLSDRKVGSGSHNKFIAFLVASGLFTMMVYTIRQINFPLLSTTSLPNIKILGVGLMSDYLLPFELAAVLLLIALVGATVIAGKKEGQDDAS